VYRSSFIAILICAFCGIFCFGAEPSSDLPYETVGSSADGQQSGVLPKGSKDTGSSGVTEDLAEEPAIEESESADDEVTAAKEDEPEIWVDQFRTVFKSSLDSGRVSGNVYWQNRDGFSFGGRFRINVNLDAVNHRFNAMIGKGDPQDLMANRFSDSSRFASFYQGVESDEFLAGVGYTPDWAKENQSISIGGGVHVTWPPAPYINLNYRARYVSPDESTMVSFYQTFYYRTDEGFGSTTTIEPAYLIADDYLLKWYNRIEVGEAILGVRYESYLTLYQDLGRQRALSYQVGVSGETDRIIPFINYGGSVTYRQQMFREWLYGEVTVGVAWPREYPEWDRRGDLLIGFGFEFFFGDGR